MHYNTQDSEQGTYGRHTKNAGEIMRSLKNIRTIEKTAKEVRGANGKIVSQ